MIYERGYYHTPRGDVSRHVSARFGATAGSPLQLAAVAIAARYATPNDTQFTDRYENTPDYHYRDLPEFMRMSQI